MLKKIKILKTNDSVDDKIRKIILVEYYARFKKKSKTPEMHMYNFPGLKEIDNEIIFKNAKCLIDANLVRGGIDEEKDHSFPWITRLTPTGIKLIEEE
jgi:hypothetical protein